MPDIKGNIIQVKERIAAAAGKSGRSSEEITIVAVTKTVEVERIKEAIAGGITDIGENYLQEAQSKWLELKKSVKWHFIGHLQRNKVKAAVEFVDLIHSVDSFELAAEIGKRSLAIGREIPVLIEVNCAGEKSKCGVEPDGALFLAEKIAAIPGIKLCGLMAIPPFSYNPQDSRPFFANLRNIFNKLPEENRQHLSMGMSGDFEIAIEEGATIVRIGTAIFGPRNYG